MSSTESPHDQSHTRTAPCQEPPGMRDRLREAARFIATFREHPAGSVIVCASDSGEPRARPLLETVTVGRAPPSDWLIRDPCLSRCHFRLRLAQEAGWILEDAGSKNGCLLNGRPLLQPTFLASGDLIVAGGIPFLFLDLD